MSGAGATVPRGTSDKHFFTGKPCRRGHLAPRLVSNGSCTECGREDHYKRKERDHAGEKARRRDHYHRNSKVMRARSSAWHKANRAKSRALNKAWHAKNPGRQEEFRQVRRALVVGAGGSFSASDIAAIKTQQRGCCAACRQKKKKLTIDHIVPLSRGGSNNPSNLQLLCGSCNSSKKDRDAIEFMRSRGYLL